MKKYQFYGWEQADVPATSKTYEKIKNPKELYDILSEIWCADTCAPRMRERWSKENQTLGQCSITAFLAQDIFGGKVYGILRPGGNYHCYNVVGDCCFDLTSEQFGDEILDYRENPEQFREVHFQKEEKRQRYEYLKKELETYLGRASEQTKQLYKVLLSKGYPKELCAEQADVPATSKTYEKIKNPKELYDILSEIWCADTCAPRMRERWSKENQTLGQCSITAFLAQDIFGGKVYGILRPGGNYHCYNVVGDCCFDLTSEQFGDEILDYRENPEQFREVHFQKEEKRQRYEYLKKELETYLGRASEQTKQLYKVLLSKGYPKELCAEIAYKNMNTDYTATRMLGYLYRVTNPRIEDLVDEMLAILSDREAIIQKKELEHAQAVLNDMYKNGL